MKPARKHTGKIGWAWHEALAAGLDLDMPGPFNIEWLIDRAEHGEWRGIWW